MTTLGNRNKTESESIIQWNCNSLLDKKEELLSLIDKVKPSVIALQETRIPNNKKITIPHYNLFNVVGHHNRIEHGGAALLVHEDTPVRLLNLTTGLQAIAAIVHINKSVTLCSIYNSDNHALVESDLDNLIKQLPQPCIIMGDLNAYSENWGNGRTGPRGKIVENVVRNNNLILLNDGSPTRITPTTETAIDITMCSANLGLNIEWSVLNTQLGSDHCVIAIEVESPSKQAGIVINKYNVKRANWADYRNHEKWNNLKDTTAEEHTIEAVYKTLHEIAKRYNTRTQEDSILPQNMVERTALSSKEEKRRLIQKLSEA